jgi:hypothetical protein
LGKTIEASVKQDNLLPAKSADDLSDHPKPATDYHLKTGQRE